MKRLDETLLPSAPLSKAQGQSLANMIASLIPDAAVFTVDQHYRIDYWSKGAEKLLGFSASKINEAFGLSGAQWPDCLTGCEIEANKKAEEQSVIVHDSEGQPIRLRKYATAYTLEQNAFNGGIALLLPQSETNHTQEASTHQFAQYGLISQSREMQKVFHLIQRVSQTDMPVLIRGESGTGKELVARAIHGESARKNQPFVAINCATLSDGLMESELFGHVKGAFTGAIRDHAGVFARANGGTLFLDEIAELPFDLQAKLLRVLETSDYIPIGAEKPIKADVRIVTATHRALREEVKAGHFRQDLLYRLRVIPIFLPRLQDRRDDIPVLIQQILKEQFTQQTLPTLTNDAMAQLLNYSWPGNVRELKNALHYALVMFDGEVIRLSDLPPEIDTDSPAEHTRSAVQHNELNQQLLMDEIERCNGNLTQAAKNLGISRTTLWRYRKKLSD